MVGERETGNETYVIQLLRALVETRSSGESFQILTPFPERLARAVDLPSTFAAVRVWPAFSALRVPVGIPAALLRQKTDVLHTTYIAPPVIPCRTVVTVHDLSFLTYPESLPPRARLLLTILVPLSVRRATRVIAISEYTRQDLVRRYRLPPEKIAVTHLAAGPAFRPRQDAHDEALPEKLIQPFLLAVGNLEPRKNLRRLVEAFAILVHDRGFPGSLVLVGKKGRAANDLVSAVRRLRLESRVVFTRFVDERTLIILYNRALAFVYPSLYEGFGLPPVEAMACGCPVVASNVSALPEVLGDAALLADPTSTTALANAMEAVWQQPQLANMLRDKGLVQAKMYSWNDTARKTRQVYAEAVHGIAASH